MLRHPLGTLAAIGLVWACRAAPGDAQKAASTPAGDSLADTASLASDSSEADSLAPELAPFVGPLAEAWTGDLDSMIGRRVIRVLVTPTRTQYWIDRGRQSGAEYELVRAFEGWLNEKYQPRRHINIYLAFIPTSRDTLIPDLLAGRGDIAAGILTFTPDRLARVDGAGPFFRGVKELVVTGPESPAVSTLEDLAGQTVVVRRSSSYWSHLEQRNARFASEGKPPMLLEPAPEDLADDDLLEMVNAGLVGITVVDRYAALLWARILPNLRVHEDVAVNEGGDVGWLVRKDSPKLKQEIDAFAKEHGQGTSIGQPTGPEVHRVHPLPDRRPLDRRHQAVPGAGRSLPEVLRPVLARLHAHGGPGLPGVQAEADRAQPGGRRQRHADHAGHGAGLGVGDINQLEPNIHGGVKFIRSMINQHFASDSVTPLNQALLALAAYNAGPGRVQRLRAEAAKQGLDRNVWRNNVELIAARRIGAETVTYVANIYRYYVAYRLAELEAEARKKQKEKVRAGSEGEDNHPPPWCSIGVLCVHLRPICFLGRG